MLAVNLVVALLWEGILDLFKGRKSVILGVWAAPRGPGDPSKRSPEPPGPPKPPKWPISDS
jgi:hypothetical protein